MAGCHWQGSPAQRQTPLTALLLRSVRYYSGPDAPIPRQLIMIETHLSQSSASSPLGEIWVFLCIHGELRKTTLNAGDFLLAVNKRLQVLQASWGSPQPGAPPSPLPLHLLPGLSHLSAVASCPASPLFRAREHVALNLVLCSLSLLAIACVVFLNESWFVCVCVCVCV